MAAGNELLPIHTLWVGERLGPLEWLCLTSWVRQGHRVVLHAYQALQAPDGVEVHDAERLWPRQRIFRHRRTGSLAVFADLYRCLILENFDAVWADADIVLLRPFALTSRNVFVCEGVRGTRLASNAFMRLEPGHPILRTIRRRHDLPWTALLASGVRKSWPVLLSAIREGSFRPEHLPWGALGYLAIQRHIARHGFDGLVLGPEMSLTPSRIPLFTPVSDEEAGAALAPPVLYVHLYRSQARVDLARPEPGSIYARLWQSVNPGGPP